MAINYFNANPDVAEAYQNDSYGLSPQEFADAHYSIYGQTEQRAAPVVLDLVSQGNLNPTQIAATTGIPVNQVIAQVATTVPPNQAVLLGDTYVQTVNQVIGSGEDQQIGGLENVITYKASENKPGGNVNYYSPTGEYQQTTQQQKVAGSFLEGLGQALTDPVVLAALAGGYGAGLFGGAGAATVGTTGYTATQLAQLDMALGGLGGFGGATGGSTLATALSTGAAIPTISSLTGGSGLLTSAPITPTSVATKLATDAEILNAGAGAFTPTTLTPVNTTPLITPTPIVPPVVTTPPVAPPVAPSVTPSVPPVAPPVTPLAPPVAPVVPPVSPTSVIPPAISSLIPTAISSLLTPTNIGNLLTSGATTAGGLLQQQTSREAAQAALQIINAETAAAKQGAQFRPIGMTTRFGTSQFVTDPVTGRLTSAGYTLSADAKNAQDRFVTLAGAGLTQAEGAQEKFKPLQTGAESLFKLGASYLAEKPETVAENYLKSQLALLKPGRDLELANIETRLRNQGRLGLSVAQGGNLGAASPELQALYNARAQQEAQLAANAQQFGQQQINFGAGLLGQGASAMGQYYGGQQQAYSPFTTALGQIQGLEQLAQQPLQMGINLGQIGAQTGFDAGRLGLQGAGQATTLATGPAATNNPYASLLSGVAANPLFGQAAASLFTPSNEQLAINPYFQRTYG